VIVLNSTTVQFVLKTPYAPFITNSLTQIPIIPQHIFDGLMEKQGVNNPSDLKLTPAQMVGSGPWKLATFNYGSQVVFERNPDYFTQPHYKYVKYTYFTSGVAALTALEQGQIDTLAANQELTPVQIRDISAYPSIEVVKIPTWTYWHLHFNMRKLPGADRAFRLALAHLINYDKIASVAFGGDLIRGAGFIAPMNTAWVDAPLVTQALKSIYNYDLTTAKKILSDAGYQWDSQGRLHYPSSLLSKGFDAVQGDNYKLTIPMNQVISTVPTPQAVLLLQAAPVLSVMVANQAMRLTAEIVQEA
jgi:peptide/nickel transport system substrate-binding protein